MIADHAARHRTKHTQGCSNHKIGCTMMFRLIMSAQRKWHESGGQNRLPDIIQGVEFRDSLRHLQTAAYPGITNFRA